MSSARIATAACTTTRGFGNQWPRIAGIASGMPDRAFFLLAPEEPKELTDETYVNTLEGSLETKKLIGKAMADGGVITISSDVREYLRTEGSKVKDPRAMNMAYTFGLYFAVDLGLGEITDNCVDRALALVEYRQQAMRFLDPIEAQNDEGRLQKELQAQAAAQEKARLDHVEELRRFGVPEDALKYF